ncbi:caspase family protein [Mesorhizobium sp. M0684]|uniref:caspase family protein n=1 Tax=Mesorhizobium sp. M0684 TaxID=2956986 RepID=UPI003339BD9B
MPEHLPRAGHHDAMPLRKMARWVWGGTTMLFSGATGRIGVAFAALLALLCALVPARAEEPKALKGVALVIGQSDYEHVGKLPNPENDARAIEDMFDSAARNSAPCCA